MASKKGTFWGRSPSSPASLEWLPKLSKKEASRSSCSPVSLCNTAEKLSEKIEKATARAQKKIEKKANVNMKDFEKELESASEESK